MMELSPGVFTPGLESLMPQWKMMREVREGIDYRGCSVLDIASYDGSWAFDAELRGASFVVATDCIYLRTFENFLFARQCLDSNVLPFFNVPTHKLFDRLDVVFDDQGKLFDIVHHLGVFYHLRDPMASLAEARSCMVDGGKLFFETAITNLDVPGMIYNGLPGERRVYSGDHTTCWAPSLKCLKEILHQTLFDVDESSIRTMKQNDEMSRCCLIATARPINPDSQDDRELSRLSRNLGIHLGKWWMGKP